MSNRNSNRNIKNNRAKRNYRKVNRRNNSRAQTMNIVRASNRLRGKTEEIVMEMFNPFTMPRLVYAPECVLVDLVYPDITFNRNFVGSTYLSWRYRMNSIYDPDPLLGSGSVPGYTFWSGAYNAYIVLKTSYSAQISNLESSPVDIVAWPSITDLGSNYSGTAEMFGNPHATVSQCAAKGGADRARLNGSIDLGHFVGNTTQYISQYVANFGANPTALYLNFGAVNTVVFTASNGVDIRVNLTMRVLLYQRKNQTA